MKLNRKLKKILSFPNSYIVSQLLFLKKFNRFFNSKNPVTFNEKIQSRKFESINATHAVLSDKFMARFIVKSLSNIKLTELYAVYKSVDEIDFDLLPKSFVIKTNHDSGSVFIVKDKADVDIEFILKELSESLNFDYGKYSTQKHYSYIDRVIIVEELLEDENGNVPFDVKVHCFHGKPKYIQIAGNTHETNDFYDINWNPIDVCYVNKQSETKLPMLKDLDEVLECSKELSSLFDYVRVDMYITNKGVVFGEMTFTPNNGLGKFTPNSFDLEMGKLW